MFFSLSLSRTRTRSLLLSVTSHIYGIQLSSLLWSASGKPSIFVHFSFACSFIPELEQSSRNCNDTSQREHRVRQTHCELAETGDHFFSWKCKSGLPERDVPSSYLTSSSALFGAYRTFKISAVSCYGWMPGAPVKYKDLCINALMF